MSKLIADMRDAKIEETVVIDIKSEGVCRRKEEDDGLPRIHTHRLTSGQNLGFSEGKTTIAP